MENREIRKKLPVLAVVVPCFNEEAVIDTAAGELKAVLLSMIEGRQAAPKSRIVFVDDGSSDGTWERICFHAGACPLVEGISLRRNVGHQNALYAGLMEVKASCDAAVSLDADLQDDPALIPQMLERFQEGKDVVYAVHQSREGDSCAKKASAFLFYRLMKMMGAAMPKDCGDFRLLSRRALEELSLFSDPEPFLRGLVPLLGLPSAILCFDRRPRRAGKSKYSLFKMLKLAANGILSLTACPIGLIFGLGLGIFGISSLGMLWLLFGSRMCVGQEMAAVGWKIAAVSVWAAAGLVLMAIGTIGLYIFRGLQEISGRPRYQIREKFPVSRKSTKNPEEIKKKYQV